MHLFDLENSNVSPGEANIQNLKFLSNDELLDERENLETWSQICVDNLNSLTNSN